MPQNFAISLLAAMSLVGMARAESAGEIREAWHAVRGYQPLEFGEFVLVAPDDYTGPGPAEPNAEQAAHLAQLARRAAEIGEAALAIRLATEAVATDPDCEPARLALGYERHAGRWLTSYGMRMAKRGLEWDSTYGWIDPDDRPRYEAGERPNGRRWITAELDAHDHDTIASGWQVRTDRFVVTTNHSLEAGAALAAQLEQLYQVWQCLFADFAIDAAELRDRFEKHRVPGVRSRPFQVIYHRTRDEYNQSLVRRQPRIAKTIGIYFDRQREAHFFFAEDDAATPTLYHESVHQLFQESDRARREPGMRDNFWAVEGVATMFESLAAHRGEDDQLYFTIATPEAGRLPAARRRRLDESYYVSLAELVTLGKGDLQGRADLVPLYSQMAGQATWLMSSPDTAVDFTRYLQQVYAGQVEPATLATELGQTYSELDAAYHDYLSQLPK